MINFGIFWKANSYLHLYTPNTEALENVLEKWEPRGIKTHETLNTHHVYAIKYSLDQCNICHIQMLTYENNSQNWKSVTVHITNNIVFEVLAGLEKAAFCMRVLHITSENIFSKKNFFFSCIGILCLLFLFSLLLPHGFLSHFVWLGSSITINNTIVLDSSKLCSSLWFKWNVHVFLLIHKFKCLNIEMHAYHISSLQTTQFSLYHKNFDNSAASHAIKIC